MTPLIVVLDGSEIATITEDSLHYAESYLADIHASRLSVSMLPRKAPYGPKEVLPWLWGLLPDNEDVLRRWARDLDASSTSVTSLLSTDIGLDCAGAVQFVRPETAHLRNKRDSHVDWFADSQVEELLKELHTDNTGWHGRNSAGQFSLAGAQAKTALRFDERTERWGDPRGNEPSTHILKPAVPGFDDQEVNEHLCLNAARKLGLRAAKTEVRSFGAERALVVTRFDRYRDPATGQWQRLHQEDMCQALGVHPATKYQFEGGPSAATVAALLRRVLPVPIAETEVWRFVDALIFNWLIGGTDAHAKNYGLVHSRDQIRLAPLYDISSFLPYDDSKGHKPKLAMKIGGEYKLKRVGRRQWVKFAEELGLAPKGVLDRASSMAERVSEAFVDAAASAEHGAEFAHHLAALVSARADAALNELIQQSVSSNVELDTTFALVFRDDFSNVETNYPSPFSFTLQLLVRPPGQEQFYYYQYIVFTLHWDVGIEEGEADPGTLLSIATEVVRDWLDDGQPDLPPNQFDALPLSLEVVGNKTQPLRPTTLSSLLVPGHIHSEWAAPTMQILRQDLAPMAGIDLPIPDSGEKSANGDDGPYDFVVTALRDVSYAAAARVHYEIEVPTYPVDFDRLMMTLNSVRDLSVGQAHAVSVNVKFDRREPNPGAFGVWQWAPGGVWGNAHQGSKADWTGYEWTPTHNPPKLHNPDSVPPSEQEFAISGLFWDKGPSTPAAEAKQEIVTELAVPIESVDQALTAVLSWTFA